MLVFYFVQRFLWFLSCFFNCWKRYGTDIRILSFQFLPRILSGIFILFWYKNRIINKISISWISTDFKLVLFLNFIHHFLNLWSLWLLLFTLRNDFGINIINNERITIYIWKSLIHFIKVECTLFILFVLSCFRRRFWCLIVILKVFGENINVIQTVSLYFYFVLFDSHFFLASRSYDNFVILFIPDPSIFHFQYM